jgi:hypothetical protein
MVHSLGIETQTSKDATMSTAASRKALRIARNIVKLGACGQRGSGYLANELHDGVFYIIMHVDGAVTHKFNVFPASGTVIPLVVAGVA